MRVGVVLHFVLVLATLGVWCIIYLPGKVVREYFAEMMREH